jgi:gluconokinase
MDVVLALDIGSSSIRCTAYEYLLSSALEINKAAGGNNNNATGEASNQKSRLKPIGQSPIAFHQISVSCLDDNGCILWEVPVDSSTSNFDLSNENQSPSTSTAHTPSTIPLLECIDLCVDQTLQQLRQRPEPFCVCAVGIATFVMNLVGVNEQNGLAGCSVTYNNGSKSVADEARLLKQQFTQKQLAELYQSTGTPFFHSAYALAQLRALYRNSTSFELDSNQEELPVAAVKGRTPCVNFHRWQSLAGLCIHRWLFDEPTSDHIPLSYSEASWTGLLNIHTGQYESAVVRLLPPTCQKALPSVEQPRDDCPLWYRFPLANTNKEDHIPTVASEASGPSRFMNQWPEMAGSYIVMGGFGDGACANVGSKCITSRRIAVTVGTSAAARVCLPYPLVQSNRSNDHQRLAIPQGLFCYRINESHVLMGGAVTDGGNVIAWLQRLFNMPSGSTQFQECMKQVDSLYNNANGHNNESQLCMLPFISGNERSPGFRSHARTKGVLTGLSPTTTAADIVKTAMESVTLSLLAIVRLIATAIVDSQATASLRTDKREDRKRGEDSVTIVASGSALENNATWRQMIADATGYSVVFDANTTQSTSRGAALLVASKLFEQQGRATTAGDKPLFSWASSTDENEELDYTSISIPRLEMRTYWDRALSQQRDLSQAISPLVGD